MLVQGNRGGPGRRIPANNDMGETVMEKTLGVVPIGMLILAALVYGLVFPFNALATQAGATFFGHAFWQVFIGGAVLSAKDPAETKTSSAARARRPISEALSRMN